MHRQLYARTDIGTTNANLTDIGGYGNAFRADIGRGGYEAATYSKFIQNYDLRNYRYKLPLP